MSYGGAYIEEFVEKKKIELYYGWFKKHNHLFQNIDLDSDLIDAFESDSVAASNDFEDHTREEDYQRNTHEEEDEVRSKI